MKYKKVKTRLVVTIDIEKDKELYYTWFSSKTKTFIEEDLNKKYKIVSIDRKEDELNVQLSTLNNDFYFWANHKQLSLALIDSFFFINVFGQIREVDRDYGFTKSEIKHLMLVGNFFYTKEEAENSDIYKSYKTL